MNTHHHSALVTVPLSHYEAMYTTLTDKYMDLEGGPIFYSHKEFFTQLANYFNILFMGANPEVTNSEALTMVLLDLYTQDFITDEEIMGLEQAVVHTQKLFPPGTKLVKYLMVENGLVLWYCSTDVVLSILDDGVLV